MRGRRGGGLGRATAIEEASLGLIYLGWKLVDDDELSTRDAISKGGNTPVVTVPLPMTTGNLLESVVAETFSNYNL